MQDSKGKGKGKSGKKGSDKGSSKGKDTRNDRKGKGKGKTWQEPEPDWEYTAKGKGKGKPRENAQEVAERLLEGKEYENAISDLCENSPIQLSDIDLWMVKLLDALHFSGHAEEGIALVKDTVAGRERPRNPRGYMFKLLTDFKKEKQAEKKQPNGAKIDEANFQFNESAPEFTPSGFLASTLPLPAPFGYQTEVAAAASPFAFSAAAPEFVMPSISGSAPATPQMMPRGQPYQTPEKGDALQALNADGTGDALVKPASA